LWLEEVKPLEAVSYCISGKDEELTHVTLGNRQVRGFVDAQYSTAEVRVYLLGWQEPYDF